MAFKTNTSFIARESWMPFFWAAQYVLISLTGFDINKAGVSFDSTLCDKAQFYRWQTPLNELNRL